MANSSLPPLIIRRARLLQVYEVQPTERLFEQKRHLFQCPAIQKPKEKTIRQSGLQVKRQKLGGFVLTLLFGVRHSRGKNQ